MNIVINIDNEEDIQDLMAVGAKDLLEHFLPKAGIKAIRVSVSHMTEENKQLMFQGEEYKHYCDEAKRGG